MEKIINRYLGLDYGTKTVGVAISDELGITAVGVETIKRDRPSKLRKTLARIESIVSETNVSGIVLGYPRHMNFDEGIRCEETTNFADSLISRLHLPIYLLDERMTTIMSDKVLEEIGYKNINKKQVLDEMAAMLILQSFLDRIANNVDIEVLRYNGKT